MVILGSTVVAMSAVAQLWEDEWEVLLISLQVSRDGGGETPGPLQQAVFYYSCLSTPRPRKGKRRAQGHTACERQGRYYNPGSLDFRHPQLMNGDEVTSLWGGVDCGYAGDLIWAEMGAP